MMGRSAAGGNQTGNTRTRAGNSRFWAAQPSGALRVCTQMMGMQYCQVRTSGSLTSLMRRETPSARNRTAFSAKTATTA